MRLTKSLQKYFSIPIEKEVTKIDKDVTIFFVTISCRIKFIHSARFMASSLSNPDDNLTEGIHKVKGKDCDFFFHMKASRII